MTADVVLVLLAAVAYPAGLALGTAARRRVRS